MTPPAEGFAARFVLGPALRTQPDRRLVTLVREGYENAFEEIVRRYDKALTRYAAAIVGGRAEDVIQDAFAKALLALRRDGAEIELRPWLFRIVRNTALNDLRDSPPTAAELADVIATGSSPAEVLERREELTDLMRRLQSLPEAQRAAIVMRELEGLSHDEIAAALGMSGGGARQAIYRARQALRDGLGMLLPLPLLKGALATAAAGGGAEIAAGAGGAAGAGVALKAATATVLVAGALGAGVAIHDSRDRSGRDSQATAAEGRPVAGPSPAAAGRADTIEGSGGGESERGESKPGDEHRGRGHGHKRGDDRSGPGQGEGDDRGSHGSGPGDGDGRGSSGHSGNGPEPTDDRSGRHGGDGGDDSGPGSGDGSGRGSGGDTSGSGDGHGSSGGDSGRSGSGDEDAPAPDVGPGSDGLEPSEPAEAPLDGGGGSGPGGGSGGSGSGSGSSGSGGD
jgi:RNA polymerase sigma factor (sigma-70 family)